MFSSFTCILKVSHISTSYEPKKKKYVIEFVIQEIGGAEGDRWRCRRLFYVVPLQTQNNCCRMNRCLVWVMLFNTSYVFRWSLSKCHATKTTT